MGKTSALKKVFLFCLVAYLLLCPAVLEAAPNDVAATNSPVEMKVDVGWQGQGVPGLTGPAAVSLENRSRDNLSGVAEVVTYYAYTPPSPTGAPGPPNPSLVKYIPSTAYGEEVSLPSGGAKKVVLWFPLPDPQGKMEFRFRVGDRILAQTEQKLPSQFNNMNYANGAIGVLGEAPPALEQVRINMPDGVPRQPVVLRLSPELLPQSGDDLEAMGTILVTREGMAGLTSRQGQVLTQWVKGGGRLLVAGGLGINETLGVLPAGTIQISSPGVEIRNSWAAAASWLGEPLAATAPAPFARLEGPGSRWGPQDEPLGLQTAVENGTVTVLAFDPGQKPWQAGDLGKALWKKLLTPEQPTGFNRVGPVSMRNQAAILGSLAGQLPRDAFPGWPLVGAFLLAFLIVAGPVTYWVLRSRRRPEYTWVAVPLLALVFTLAAYLYMLQSNSNVLVNVLEVVDSRSPAQAYTAVGFFAPTFPDFNVSLADPGYPVQAQMFEGPPPEYQEPGTAAPFTITRSGNLIKLNCRDLSQWNMRTATFRQEIGNKLDGLTARLLVTGSGLTIRVVNHTGIKLDHVALLLGRNYKCLGDIKPGQEAVAAAAMPSPPRYDPSGYNEPPNAGLQQIFLNPGGASLTATFPSGKATGANPGRPRSLTVDEQRRANLLNSWLSSMISQGPGWESIGWPITLVAWSQDAVQQVDYRGVKSDPHYLSMIVKRLELDFPEGAFNVPYGLVIPNLVDSQTNSGFFGQNNLFGFGDGFITYAFRPGIPSNTQLQEIRVQLQYFPTQQLPWNQQGGPPAKTPEPVAPGVLEIYHPGQGRWVELSGQTEFRLPGAYAQPDGEVQLRINGMGDPGKKGSFYFLPPAVGYEGVMRP